MPLDLDDPYQWLVLAEEDRLAARRLIMDSQPPVIRIGCFHIQQAIEKTLKGVWVARGVDPPRTHDIGRLLKSCLPDPTLDRLYDTLDATTYFAVDIRNGEIDTPSLDEVRSCLMALDELMTWAKREFSRGRKTR